MIQQKVPKTVIPEPKCEILGPVSIIIQSCLGLIAILSLALKRKYEHPKRPWKIWFFDVSKQVFCSFGIHVLNLTVSLLKSKNLLTFTIRDELSDGNATGENDGNNDEVNSECDWYFVNLLMDTTIGVPILWVILLSIYQVCEALQISEIKSGCYGNPPKVKPYLKQLLIFFISSVVMKCCIYLLLYIPIFIIYANWILSWSDNFPNLQIVLVMLVFPTLLNCFQYYVIDNIIKFPTDL